MYIVEYFYKRPYRFLPDARGIGNSAIPAIQIVLSHHTRESDIVFAVLDSGAAYSLFSFGIGASLGLDVFTGEEIRLSSLGSIAPIPAYLHEIDIEVLTYHEEDEVPWIFSAHVAFAASDIPRNILGRTGFFEHATVGFVEKEQTVYLSPSLYTP